MKKISFIFIFLLSFLVNAQEKTLVVADQNTNHFKVSKKYLKKSASFTLLQGTTSQETYKAIDPMEEKRERKKIRKDYRSQRSLWRHQERMERAKNTRYYNGHSGSRYFSNNYIHSFLTLGALSLLLVD